MITTTTTKGRRRAAGIVSLMAAIGMAFVTLAGAEAGAGPKSHKVSGNFDFQVAASPACPAPNCVLATFRGGIKGPGEGPNTAVFPAQPPTNLIAEGLLTIHTSDGDLNLAGTAVFNPDPASDGEIVFLFKIVGGTGGLTGASGYIMAAGTSEVPGAMLTGIKYTGRLVLP